MTALIIGTLLAVAALAYVLYPLFFAAAAGPAESRAAALDDAGSMSTETVREKELAVAALREIEFDRATGKLSDADYAQLKQRYTERAIAAMRAEDAGAKVGAPEDEIEAAVLAWRARQPRCTTCGPRPEADAVYCSTCGSYLAGRCAHCGAPVPEPGARFCSRCGHTLAA